MGVIDAGGTDYGDPRDPSSSDDDADPSFSGGGSNDFDDDGPSSRSFHPVTIHLDDDDDSDDGDDSPSSSDTPIADRTGGPIGSGTIDTTIDPETGDAQEIITGGGGSATTDAKKGDDKVVASNPASGGGTDSTDQVDRQQDIEQAVEDATNGAAFGDEDVDDIGSGEAVVDVTDDTTSETPESSSGLTDRQVLAVLGVLAVGGIAVAGGST